MKLQRIVLAISSNSGFTEETLQPLLILPAARLEQKTACTVDVNLDTLHQYYIYYHWNRPKYQTEL